MNQDSNGAESETEQYGNVKGGALVDKDKYSWDDADLYDTTSDDSDDDNGDPRIKKEKELKKEIEKEVSLKSDVEFNINQYTEESAAEEEKS
jgi:hypothetical protein